MKEVLEWCLALYMEKHLSNTLFEIGEMELNEIISKHGQHGVINVELDGREHIALIKEVQREPVNHKIIHMDLEESISQ